VHVLDFAEEGGNYLLILDYVHGYHLGQWARFMTTEGRRFPVDLAIYIVCKVLDALHYANTAPGPKGQPLGVVHRDVSPSNVLLDINGTVKLADFGIARMHSDKTETTGADRIIKGKLAYMAPELVTLEPPTAQSDIYAVAIVLHEILLGSNEMRVSGSIEVTAARTFFHVPTPPSQIREDAPKGLDAVISRGFAKSAGSRFRDAQEFARALRALQTASEDELAQKLAAAIDADFRSAKMPAAVGGHRLATLDRAWRASPDDPPSSSGRPAPLTAKAAPVEVETLVEGPPALAAPSTEGATALVTRDDVNRGGSSKRAPWLALGGVAALAAAAGLYVVVGRPPPPAVAPSVFVIGGEVAGTDGLAFEAGVRAPAARPDPVASTSAAAPTDAPAAAAAARPAAVPHPAATGVEALTRAFARREPQVAACFDANATDIHGTPELAIRFALDVQGHVTSAQVLPPEVASTPLGACLSGVARSTQFGPQAQTVSFRIPIVARRGH
jgi:hypothetical protein